MFLDLVAFVAVLLVVVWCFLLLCGGIGLVLAHWDRPNKEHTLNWEYVRSGFLWLMITLIVGRVLFWCFDRVVALLG